MQTIGVECVFAVDGDVRVKRVQLAGGWLAVGQGRQWVDDNGRHVLIMLPNNQVRELILSPQGMQWLIKPAGRRAQLI